MDGAEKALWGKVIASVKPLHPVRPVTIPVITVPPVKSVKPREKPKAQPAAAINSGAAIKPQMSAPAQGNMLDGSWDRRMQRGVIIPDVSVDLHGQGLSSAYRRLDGALEQAIAQKMRVILLVTGKARKHDRTSGEGRGAIASVVRDWLAASRHSASISAVRNSHPRHGGEGALYIVLKR
jgi:DNA-nicking Smr family endonuclease